MKARTALAVLFLVFGGSVARGVEIIGPGSSLTLEVPYENEDTSTATAKNARIVATFENVSPTDLETFLSIDQAGSELGPFDIPIGAANAKTFKAKVVVADGAPAGSFTVRLHPTVENVGLLLSPALDVVDTSVIVMVASTTECGDSGIASRKASVDPWNGRLSVRMVSPAARQVV